jgi:stage II sporulation protein P
VGVILQGSNAVQEVLDSSNVRRALEDQAMRTYAPGYTAVIEGEDGTSWSAQSLQQIAPVYSYLAEGQGKTEKEEESDGVMGQTENSGSDLYHDTGLENETIKDSEKVSNREDYPEVDELISEKSSSSDEEGYETNAEDTNSEKAVEENMITAALSTSISGDILEQIGDFSSLIANFYTVDEGTVADETLLDAETLLSEDLSIEKDPGVPQILIYHTHSQESFADSREGEASDTIVGMGDILARELEDTYGYQVIHDTGVYDLVDGVLDRSAAYDYARTSIEQILTEHPEIEVIIDLHRDGVEGQKFVTEIDGRPTAMIMFFNGISRNAQDQPISYLENPYTSQNLAFSLQLQLLARTEYPGFTRNIYLKAERFNLHFRPRSLLIEAGTQLNTVQEEQNAMYPLAALLDEVLQGTESQK